MMRSTGLIRRHVATQSLWTSSRLFRDGTADPGTFIQPLACLHNQLRKPSCAAQGHGQGVESVTGERVGCVPWWEGARTLQGDARDAEAGTRSEYVIRWVERHGWPDYTAGEDARPTALDADGRVADSLADAMRDHQRPSRIILHKTIDTGQTVEEIRRQIIAALRLPRHYVVYGSGCRDSYFDPPPDVVLGTDYRCGNKNGHMERIAGWSEDRQAFLNQGSWGNFTWCLLPDGTKAIGCCWISPDVPASAWELDVVEVLP